MKASTLTGVAVAIIALGFSAGTFLWWTSPSADDAKTGAPATADAVLQEVSIAVTAIADGLGDGERILLSATLGDREQAR